MCDIVHYFFMLKLHSVSIPQRGVQAQRACRVAYSAKLGSARVRDKTLIGPHQSFDELANVAFRLVFLGNFALGGCRFRLLVNAEPWVRTQDASENLEQRKGP